MNTKTSSVRLGSGAPNRLVFGRVRTMFLAAAAIAALGMATTVRADRVNHDVAAGTVTVIGVDNTDTYMIPQVVVNGFGVLQNSNASDHKIIIGDTEADDVANGALIATITELRRTNSNNSASWPNGLSHTVSANGAVNSGQSYEVASQGVPLTATTSVGSPEDNVNFAAAWFPYATWVAGYVHNSGNTNGGTMDTLIGTAGLELGVHFFDYLTNSAVSDAERNGVYYLDLRSLGIDSRRDGVLLVNHAKNEANYAGSRVNNDDDEMDGTWTIYVHDNRRNGQTFEQDPVTFVFVPRTNTAVVSGMFMGDATIAMYSGDSPQFTVENRTDISQPSPDPLSGGGIYELKINGRTPKDGVLIVSLAVGDPLNSDNIVECQPNPAMDGWYIVSRDLPNPTGTQNVGDTEVVCSFVFIPAERPGITVTPDKNLMTTESGGSAQFTVTLNGYPKPTADVTVNLSSSDTTEGTVFPSTLTFTPADWNVPMTVTITGVDDTEADGTKPYTINLSSTVSADPGFNGLTPPSVGAINIDNEAGISVDASQIVTTESGGTAMFNVWLNTMPTADVTIGLSSSDLTEATVFPGSLTFTPGDFSVPQTVTVTGVDDFVQDGTVNYLVVTAPATSADPAYNNSNALDVQGENLDNDRAGVVIPAGALTVSEPNTTTSFPVVLTSQPTEDVVIHFVSSDTTEGTVQASKTFTAGNWNVPQNVIVTAVDDLVNDGPVQYSIITSVTSTDPVYDGMIVDNVSVTTLDNEADFTLPSGGLDYGVGAPAVGIDGYATVTDPDTANYNSGSLTVTITGALSTDRLVVRNAGTGAGQIGVAGSTVSYAGVNFGTISGGTGTTPLAIAFNSVGATPEAVQALVRSVTYQNVDPSAAASTRTVTFVIADGHSGVATEATTITIRLMRVYTYQQDADGGFGPYTGAADVQIAFDQPYSTFPAGSSVNGLWIDWNENSLFPTDQSQAFLRFTNVFGTDPGQIPPGAKIVSAELIMNVTDSGHGARFNRMLIDWDPDYATFAGFVDGISLDDAEAVSGTNTFLGDQAHNTTTGIGVMTIGVTEDVQAWCSGENNYGWVLTPWEGGANGTAFSPCEYTNITLRPKLKIAWVPATASSVAFRQDQDGYTGAVDTSIRLVLPDTGYPANTQIGPDAMVNATPVPNPSDALIKFENIIGTGAGQIPPGSTIHAAILDLTGIGADAQGNGGLFYALYKPWDDTATWNTWDNGITPDGVEAATTPTVTMPATGIGTVQATRYNIEVTSDVQTWANGAKPNNGWAILPWDGGNNGWFFSTAEEPNTRYRPQLRVYFEPGILLMAPTYNGSSVVLPFIGAAGTTYTVQRTGTLGGTWADVGTATAGVDGTASYTDNSPLPGAGFYRVKK